MATNTGTAVETIPTLEVRRTIRAPQQRVYDAWTTAEELKRWHAPGPLTVSLAELDVRVGGRFRIHMQEPDGKEHRVSGVYQLVDPPNKLVYSWGWDGDHAVKDSTVTIEFHQRGAATEVVLTHAIADAAERTGHEKGWTAIFDKLVTIYDGAAS